VGAEEHQKQRVFYANGMGGYPIIGDPDHVAKELSDLSKAGLSGIGLSFINYLDELPYFREEVMARLAHAGVRQKN
jgi:FMNH2-dependent dimethyl sulfone monooxygenase